MLFINDVPIDCINQAAVEYYVPATLIISILKTENGRVGSKTQNKNGTYDLGSMQINSSWMPYLKKKGISEYQVQYDPCTNVQVGAWILSNSITEARNIEEGIGNYNSHTPNYNFKYRQKVIKKYNQINQMVGSVC